MTTIYTSIEILIYFFNGKGSIYTAMDILGWQCLKTEPI